MKTYNAILKTGMYGLLTLVFIFCANSLLAQETGKLQGFIGKGEKIKAKSISTQIVVDRGRKKDGCLGRGSCGVYPYFAEEGMSQLGERQYLATISRKGNQFTITIETKDISMATFNEQFSDNSFQVDEDLELPEEVCKALGIKGKARIGAGNYAVVNQPTSLYVVPSLIVNY